MSISFEKLDLRDDCYNQLEVLVELKPLNTSSQTFQNLFSFCLHLVGVLKQRLKQHDAARLPFAHICHCVPTRATNLMKKCCGFLQGLELCLSGPWVQLFEAT